MDWGSTLWGSILWGSTLWGYRFRIWICIYSPRGLHSGGLHSGGLLSEGLLSGATDFGSGTVLITLRSGGLHSGGLLSGGLLSRATDFGSGPVLITLRSAHRHTTACAEQARERFAEVDVSHPFLQAARPLPFAFDLWVCSSIT